METSAYWDSVAGEKPFTVPFYPEKISTLPKDAPLLDFGCGYGRTLLELRQLGYHNLYGMDISPKMIELTGKTLPEADLRIFRGTPLPYPDESFAGVLLLGLLTAVPDSEEQSQLIGELSRILLRGGLIYVGDFLLNHDERNLARYRRFESKYQEFGVFETEDGAVLRHHSTQYLQELFRQFRQSEYQTETFTTMNGHVANGFTLICEK